ncbi:hypothetical protein BJV78DRAFT_1186629 [Lactifluus subvellereus]|nr:hypothetical protein BJV78DRAFT_1186629 [Lactifluus subvellereus]
MEPPPNFGVFNKGRASAKIKVDEPKRTRHRGHPRIFSEDRLLNSRPANPMSERHPETEHSEASSSSSTSHESSLAKAENVPAVQVRTNPIKIRGTKGRRQSATPRCDSEEETGSDTESRHEAKWTPPPEPTQSRSPAQSACWVIEQDGCSLPSTSSDVSVPSAKSKAETAFLDVRTAAWNRILKNPSLGGGVLFPPEYHETPQAISSLPIPTIVKEVTSKAPPGFEEPASIDPWESASQVARGTLPQQEQKSVYSRFFALPHSDEPGFAQPTTQLAGQSLDRLAGVDSTRSDHSANATIDEPLVYEGASMDNRGEDPLPRTSIISAPEHTLTARETVTPPNDSVSVPQTPSLDSIERALLDVPEVTCHPSQIRRRSVQRRNFSFTSQNMIFYQYGLDPIDNHCGAPRHILRDDGYSEPGDASPLLGNSADVGSTQYCALSLRGEDDTEGAEGNIEDVAGCHEYHAGVISDSHEFANDMVYTQPNASDEWQNEALFFTSEEDIGYGETIVGTKECCDGLDSASMASADRSALPEGDVDRMTNIHLWDDEAWPREEAVGRSVVHGEVSHLTAVQKVEQDVARKLKGHWFPHKF